MTKLNPWWITGFIAGEGCFYVGFEIIKNKKISVRISFSVSQITHLLLQLYKK
jgi:hypothetical protein